MSSDFTTHEEDQFTILQLMDLLERHTETIACLKGQSLDLRGFAELDANVEEQNSSGQGDQTGDQPTSRECSVGGDECTNLHLTPCMHVICVDCANHWFVQRRKNTCPMCRHRPISMNDLVQCPTSSAAAYDQQFDIDLLRCRLAEYRGMIHQVSAQLRSNVAPSFNNKFMEFLWEQVLELQDEIARAVVVSDGTVDEEEEDLVS